MRGLAVRIKTYLHDTFLAMGSRDYRLFATGQAISVCGMWMQRFGQAWLVLQITDSSFILGITVALQQVPLFFFTTSGGAIADRFNRRRILLFSNAAGMLPALAIGTVVVLGMVQIWMVFAAALFQGLIDALEKPARMTLVNDLVPPKLLTNAVMLNNVIQNTGKLVGPAVAGIVIGSVGISAAFFVNAASYLPVVAGLCIIRPKYVQKWEKDWQGSIRHTLGYVRRRRPLLVALLLVSVVGMFGYNFQILIPVMFRNEFHGSATVVGLGLTWMGLGGVIGGLVLAGKMKATARGLVLSSIAFGVGLVLLGISPDLPVAYAACFAAGAISVVFAAMSGAHIQLSAEREMRGRLMGLYIVALAGTGPLGGLFAGAVAQWTNGRVAFVLCAAAVLLACAAAYPGLNSEQARTRARDNDVAATGQIAIHSATMIEPG